MKFIYPAVFRRSESGGYNAFFPDLECCEAAGDTLDEAIDNANEAARNWISVELEEDEYFIADLIGMSVVAEDGTVLGTLADVMPTGANDVYVVRTENGKELLIPAIKECILNVDVEERAMRIHVMDGLLNL